MSTVLVTGVTGFVGGRLAAELSRRGHRVMGSTSAEAGLRAPTAGVVEKVMLRLGDTVDTAILRAVDAVVHCAWDLRPGGGETSAVGTERLAEACRTVGVRHQLFISSYSAHHAAVTEYGRAKLAVQTYMIQRGHAAARLGVVVGPGGIYRRMAETLARHRFVPLVDGGRASVPIIAITDLDVALAAIVERRLAGAFNLFNPELVPLHDLLFEIRRLTGSRALLVPVPARLLLGPLWLAAKVGVKLPLDADNIRAMRANLGVRDGSDLPAFVPRPMGLTAMVQAAAAGR
jgi:nucleoside-diphosphate-sugar epimerase